jgi:hypothetical protein
MKFSTTLVAILATTILLAACGARSSDEDKLRALIDAVETAAEARDSSDVLEYVASNYSDSRGLDKTQLRNFLRGYFLANPKIELLVSVADLEIPVPGLARARVTVTSVLAGDREVLQVEFRQEGGEWRVVRADRAR